MSKLNVRVKNQPDKAIKRLKKIAEAMSEAGTVKVGLPKGSNNYPDGTSVIMVGSVHEFGSPARGVPQRSYLRSTMKEQRRAYKALFKKLAKKIAKGEITSEEAMNILGLKVQTDVREKITELKAPPLKSRDGNPLIDTGHLRQSIIYEVS